MAHDGNGIIFREVFLCFCPGLFQRRRRDETALTNDIKVFRPGYDIDSLHGTERALVAQAYSDALAPIFLYVVPLLLVGFVLMLFLKEHPLAKSINHTGHPSDDSL